MGSLSADKAGVGSAVNDTTRELGGTLGVADRRQRVQLGVRERAGGSGKVFSALPPQAQRATEDSVSAAGQVATRLGRLGARVPHRGVERLPVGALGRLPRGGRRGPRRGRRGLAVPPGPRRRRGCVSGGPRTRVHDDGGTAAVAPASPSSRRTITGVIRRSGSGRGTRPRQAWIRPITDRYGR